MQRLSTQELVVAMGLTFCIALLSLAGCGQPHATRPPAEGAGTPAAKPTATPSEQVPERPLADRAEHMLADFATTIDARDAVIDGDLARVRSLTAWIAAHDYSGILPPRWMPWMESMQQDAAAAAKAPDADGAAMAIAAMARSCGDCHFNFEKGPALPPLEDQGFAPTGPEQLETRMERHEYAADDMWLGLIVPSNEAWERGARALTEAPAVAPVHGSSPLSPRTAGEVSGIQEIGQRALAAGRVEDRVKIYAEFLGACAGCHRQSRH